MVDQGADFAASRVDSAPATGPAGSLLWCGLRTGARSPSGPIHREPRALHRSRSFQAVGRGFAPVSHGRPHRWGIGAFLLVEVVYLVTSAALTVAVVRHGRLTAGIIAMGIAVPTTLAAGVAILITNCAARARLPTCGCGGRGAGRAGTAVRIRRAVGHDSRVDGLSPDRRTDANSAVGRVFQGLRVPWPWAVAVFLLVVLVAPVCEEIVSAGCSGERWIGAGGGGRR